MVVEDNQDDENLATRVFRRSGLEVPVEVARDGDEALRLLRDRHPPSLVLLDLKLPRLSGIEVLLAIRDNPKTRTVPVVVLTSSDERTDLAACYDLGCNAFVRKPVDYNEYIDELSTTINFWLRVNRTPALTVG